MDKKTLRKHIRNLKAVRTEEENRRASEQLMCRIEAHPRFVCAETVLFYHSLPDEVYTHDFIRKWASRKQILLPVVVGDTLEIRRFSAETAMNKNAYGIAEPTGCPFSDIAHIDLAIIPGMAFDRDGNRLGRGKGYYDRLLSCLRNTGVYKIGLCYDFQLLPQVPAEAHDVPMDEVIC